MAFGTLKRARCSLQNAISSASSAVWPGRSVTAALTASPHFGSGIAKTAHSATAACSARAPSISAG